MTYFGFLLRFIVAPTLLLLIVIFFAHRRGKRLPDTLRSLPFIVVLLGHVLVALVYTTPWDNYLVATGRAGTTTRSLCQVSSSAGCPSRNTPFSCSNRCWPGVALFCWL